MSATVAVVSGGMDSVTMLYKLFDDNPEERLIVASFDYGQKHLKELAFAAEAASEVDAEHVIITLPELHGSALTDADHAVPEGHYEAATMRQTVVPNRNMVMLSVAISLAVDAGARRVATAVHAGDHAVYPDCRPEFISAMTDTARIACDSFIDPAFEVVAPFVHISKTDIAAIGYELGVPWDRTWSCYVGGDVHCAHCGTCTERIEALGDNDPTVYADPEHAARIRSQGARVAANVQHG
jgi:7-cyano-7-deazaguanine synthase